MQFRQSWSQISVYLILSGRLRSDLRVRFKSLRSERLKPSRRGRLSRKKLSARYKDSPKSMCKYINC